MAVRFVNNFSAALAAGIDSVETVLTFAAGVGDAFRLLLGSPLSTDHIYLTLYNSGGDIEYVKCTSTSGDEFTVVRGQDNSTARAWLADDMVACRPNAASLQEATTIPTDLAHSGINIDITEMRGLTTPLSPTLGGTGVVSLAALKTAMGLDIGVNVSAYVAPGASGNIQVSNGTAWTSQSPALTELAETTLSESAWINKAHSLGVVPSRCLVSLRCKTSEYGYSVNDEILFSSGYNITSATDRRAVVINATNVSLFFGNYTFFPDKTTGVGVSLTPANWAIVVRVGV